MNEAFEKVNLEYDIYTENEDSNYLIKETINMFNECLKKPRLFNMENGFQLMKHSVVAPAGQSLYKKYQENQLRNVF